MVKVLATTFLLILATNSTVQAGFEDLGVGARPISMGLAFVGLAEGPEAIFFNPAGLGTSKRPQVNLFYCRPYGLDELAYGTISVMFPGNFAGFGMALQSFGNKLYRENTFVASFAGNFQGRLYYGLNFRYMGLAIQGYGSVAAFGLDFGFLIPLSTEVKWGFFSRNSNQPTMGNKKLPQAFSTGVSINAASNLLITFDLYKEICFPLEIRWGSELKLLDHFILRSGVDHNPPRFSFGFGVPLAFCNFDYAFYAHHDLGLTHQVSFSIRMSKRTK